MGVNSSPFSLSNSLYFQPLNPKHTMELSIIIPAYNEGSNISLLIDKIRQICDTLNCLYEIIVVDGNSRDGTLEIVREKGAVGFIQKDPGYGGALRDGINFAKGKYIITLDADLSHNPFIIKRLFYNRDRAHILIASRYVSGGLANMPFSRRILSIILNKILCWGLSLPLHDISSGFRLYRAEIFKEIEFMEKDFNALVEVLVKAYMNGFSIKEIPFHYQPRSKGKSHAKVIKFGIGYFATFFKMWKQRNTIASADYDARAYDSRIFIQRYWQRKRYKIICALSGFPDGILDVGCGTSKILGAFPQAIGIDLNFKKLRYNLALGNDLINADAMKLPLKNACFETVICSEVIEHLPADNSIFFELSRVIKKGGTLIIGTPDYARFSWVMIEWLYKKIVPGGYSDQHITHYTRQGLKKKLEDMGFKLEGYKYILGSELICKFVKVF